MEMGIQIVNQRPPPAEIESYAAARDKCLEEAKRYQVLMNEQFKLASEWDAKWAKAVSE